MEGIFENTIKKLMKECLVEYFGEEAPTQIRKVLNISQTEEYIGKSSSWIYQNKEILPQRVSDKPILYLKEDLDKWLEANKKGGEGIKTVGDFKHVKIRAIK